MTPEEFLAAIIAIHKYLSEAEKPIEIRQSPTMWKINARMIV